ncbi:hypothetical protein [Kaarinaea lacus]
MKPTISLLLVFYAAIGIGGCASTHAPNASSISALPVVELGQEQPDNVEYILLLRSGVNVPVTVSISGSLLTTESKVNTNVQLKRDVYLYKHWSSLDGKTWGEKNINLLIGTGLDTKGGMINVTVDEIALNAE